ncbi:hypothetical protein NDU88_005278 [Pleurodeles waltl]|uniref:Uncharacterized protein n=1 Tax=Pleurodeles waltl TaxID=8319 RepID=A0AAV7VIK9_PLEWA|nr:hypothetical protein NDU88_005278 [Pleurodeles waltl]
MGRIGAQPAQHIGGCRLRSGELSTQREVHRGAAGGWWLSLVIAGRLLRQTRRSQLVKKQLKLVKRVTVVRV